MTINSLSSQNLQTSIDSKLTIPPAWTGYSPLTGGITAIGNGSTSGSYSKLGKTVVFQCQLGTGSTTTYNGSLIKVSLPFTAVSQYALQATFYNGINFYPIWCYASGDYAELYAVNAASTYGILANVTGTVPVTLGASMRFYISGSYESTT